MLTEREIPIIVFDPGIERLSGGPGQEHSGQMRGIRAVGGRIRKTEDSLAERVKFEP